jgi:hypothetical protein
MKPIYSACLFASLVLTLGCGCASQPSAESLARQRMKSNPEQYRRVEILPIWVTGVGDPELSTNELSELSHRAGSNIIAALSEVLGQRGYSVVESGPVLCDESDTRQFDDQTRQLLIQVRTNSAVLSQELAANRPNRTVTTQPFLLDPCVSELRKRLASSDADLLFLVESRVRFESKEAHDNRVHYNKTTGAAMMPLYLALIAAAASSGAGGGAPDFPLVSTPSWIAYSIIVADARTSEVLFWNGRAYPHENPRNPDALRGKLGDTLAELAHLPKPK